MARDGRHDSAKYTDRQAAEELRKELRRYARDKESLVGSALDFAGYIFTRLGYVQTAELLEKEKADFLDCQEHAFKEVDVQSALQFAVQQLFEIGYNGCAITLENAAVEQFGELDETRALTKEEKMQRQHGQDDQIQNEVDKAKDVERFRKSSFRKVG